jgi:5-formyltetrahydrofolate cyclo-ligase
VPDPGDVREAKAKLRKQFLESRSAMDPALRAALSERIAARLAEVPEFADARVVHLYIGAVGGEVATRAIALDILQAGKRLVCPRVVGGQRLEHHEVRSLDELVESARGLWEPDPHRSPRMDPSGLDLILVPGIAFDRLGNRLGFGRGYYDRFLSALSAPKVALAFSLQIADSVPHSPLDVPVDWVVTESETIACRANREAGERESHASQAGR